MLNGNQKAMHEELLESYLEQIDKRIHQERERKFINAPVGKEFGNGSVIAKKTRRLNDEGEIVGYDMEFSLSPQDEMMDTAAKLQQSIIEILQTRGELGKAALAAMWKIYRDGLVTYLGEYNPENFRQWVEDTLMPHDESKYITNLAFVVERILQDVHAQNRSPMPYKDSVSKMAITVNRLITAKGSTSKLIEISSAYTLPTTTHEQRQEMLDMIVTGKTREAVRQKRDEVNGQPGMKLPYAVEMRNDGLFDLTMTGLTAMQVKLAEKLFGTLGDKQI